MLDSLIKADHSATDENGLTQLFASAKEDESPINFSIENLKPRHAGRRALVGSCHATGIQKQNASASFISRHVRVPVQQNIDVSRRLRRRNMLKTEFQSTADKIDNQRPFKVAVAISAHERDSRTDSAKFIQNSFCTNVSKVPDLICILRHLADVFRQAIMRISQNKNP